MADTVEVRALRACPLSAFPKTHTPACVHCKAISAELTAYGEQRAGEEREVQRDRLAEALRTHEHHIMQDAEIAFAMDEAIKQFRDKFDAKLVRDIYRLGKAGKL